MVDIPMDGKGSYIYEAIEITNYDGDSVRCTLTKKWDFGFHIHVEQTYHVAVRVKGVDTPELRDKRPDWKAAGYLARDAVKSWFLNAVPGFVKFISMDKPDKYGRALGDFEDADGNRLSQFLLDTNLGVAYEGGSKAEIEAMHAKNIAILKEDGRI